MRNAKVSHPDGKTSYVQPNGWRSIDVPSGCESVWISPTGCIYFDMGRAGGGVECAICGRLLYDHPAFDGVKDHGGNPFLTLGCGAKLYKL